MRAHFEPEFIGRKTRYKMREYFLPTIRLTTWTCLIVSWKCWPSCTRTIIGRKQGYKMREYVLPENGEQKFGWKSVSILYHFFRTISSGIKKVAQKAQKNCFPLLRSGTKKYIICPNDDQQLWKEKQVQKRILKVPPSSFYLFFILFLTRYQALNFIQKPSCY